MKKLFTLVLAMMIATSAVAFAGQAKPVKSTYSGVVEKYDAASKTLTVKRKDKQGEFVIVDSSEVLDNKTKADASALTAGRKVEVQFVMDGAKKNVVRAKLSGPATSK